MMRTALYIRVSTEEQKVRGLSLEAQQASLEEWARREGAEVVGRYADPGVSARKKAAKRPGLQRMLADVRAGKIDLIVFTKLDRWFRNVGEYYKVQEILEEHHVNWKTVFEDYDTSTAAGRLKVNIMLSVAQDEADRTSERIKVVFDAKREKREPLSGSCPTGYRIEGRKLVKDEAVQEAVAAFFQRFLASGSISEAQALAWEEHRLRIEYQLASKMLDSPAYYGFYYGVEGMCPPYLTKEEYDKIQSMRKRAARKVKDSRVYLFSGLVVCGECGSRMGGRTNTRGGTAFYNCPGRYVRRTCGSGVNLAESKIERFLLEAVHDRLSGYEVGLENLRGRQGGKNRRSEAAAVRAKLSRLKDLYLNELISLEEYRRDQGRLKARLEELSRRAGPAEALGLEQAEALLAQGWRAAYEDLDRSARRDFWRILIREIRVYPDRRIECDLNAPPPRPRIT